MISYLDCYPCMVRHILLTARQVTENEEAQREVLARVMRLLAGMAPGASPVRMAAEAHRVLREVLEVDDPYLELKRRTNRLALDKLEGLQKITAASPDRIETAVRIAIAGNIIDFGAVCGSFDLDAALRESLKDPLGVNDYPRLREDLRRARRLLYVGDNAGEIVFDRLLVEELKRAFPVEITFVVRGRPILNDATLEDAETAGLIERVRVIASGGDGPGCELDRSKSLRPLFEQADLVISKGQGNYESLSLEPYPIYFLLRVKCKVVAREINAPHGSSVVKRADFRAP